MDRKKTLPFEKMGKDYALFKEALLSRNPELARACKERDLKEEASKAKSESLPRLQV